MISGIDRQALQYIASFEFHHGREPSCHEMRDFYRRHLSEVLDTRGGVSLSSAQASGAAVSPLATISIALDP